MSSIPPSSSLHTASPPPLNTGVEGGGLAHLAAMAISTPTSSSPSSLAGRVTPSGFSAGVFAQLQSRLDEWVTSAIEEATVEAQNYWADFMIDRPLLSPDGWHAYVSRARVNIEAAKELFLTCYRTRSEELSLLDLGLTSLPDVFDLLTHITTFHSLNNKLTNLPASFASLTELTTLSLNGNNFSVFPEVITRLTKLNKLCCLRNEISEIPASIAALTELRSLTLDSNKLTALPEELLTLPKLEEIWVNANEFPDNYRVDLVERARALKASGHHVPTWLGIAKYMGPLTKIE